MTTYLKPAKILLLLLVVLASCTTKETKETKENLTNFECPYLDTCLNEIDKIKYSKYGISQEAIKLAERLASFGNPALPVLIKRLNTKDTMELKIIGYAIGEIPDIDEKYLPQIIDGVERDVPWLARALGNIHTNSAAKAALQAYLNASTSPSNQEAGAVTRQGERAVPFILEETISCDQENNSKKTYLLTHAVGEMNDNIKKDIAIKIINHLENNAIPLKAQQCLVSLFFEMGDSGKFVENQLMAIRTQHPELAHLIDRAFLSIKSTYSVPIYISLLKQTPDIFILSDLSELGPMAHEAGPLLIKLLSHEDREIRFSAARTLGYIRYTQAEPDLIPLLSSTEDVLLNSVTATTLGRLGQKTSLEPLKITSDTHWFPPVRTAAKQAIEMINTKENSDNQPDKNNYDFGFLSIHNFQIESCEEVDLKHIEEDTATKLYKHTNKNKLQELEYDSYILSYGASNEEEQLKEDPDGIIEVTPQNMVEHRENIKQIPDMALKVSDGWLAGSSRGEWGGELVFIPKNKPAIKLLDENIEDIYQHGEHYIAVTGLAHLGLNRGMIYKIEKKQGNWIATSWISLPGAPFSSWFVETGELLVNTYGGGSILLAKSGKLRMAPCVK